MLSLTIEGIIISLTVSGTLQQADFIELGKNADLLIAEHGSIRLCIDAQNLQGWEDFDTAEHHFSFVRLHHKKVEKLAIITGHHWHQWLIAMARIFVHPEVKAFDVENAKAAKEWIKKP